MLQCSLSLFLASLSWRVFHLIYPHLDHLHPPPVDHPNPYLSTCPIRHPLWFLVSCGSQGSAVQRSSPYKCGQKSSCIAFNAVVATFPYIFLDFLPSRMFKRHVSIIGVSWKITLTDGVHIVNYGPLPLQYIYIYIYIYLYRLPVEVEKFLLVYMLIPILLSFYLPFFFFFFFLVSRKSCSSFSRSFKFFEVVLVRWTSWLSNLSYADSSVHKKVLGM